MKAKWCCEGMKHSYEDRKGRTIFAFAIEDPNSEKASPLFWLGSRAVEQEHLGKINFKSEFPVTMSTRVPIIYCPWCGVNLAKHYSKSYGMLVDSSLETIG
ncbi:hypothetical protein [Microbulbifer sp. TRSA005]|uniref:hypothetical protein n=1 Tax=Microbulbifer sp. TRSA005 TaxID=3243383 RepID=UPI0040391132